MKNNLYWNVYKSLERELLALAEIIHIDDKQLDVYSMKIADLLIRTSVEIESISKELYFREGGTKPDDKDLLGFVRVKMVFEQQSCYGLKSNIVFRTG